MNWLVMGGSAAVAITVLMSWQYLRAITRSWRASSSVSSLVVVHNRAGLLGSMPPDA